MANAKDRADRAAGRAINILYGLQALGGAVASLVLALFGYFVDAPVLIIAGLLLSIVLTVIGVSSIRKRERLSEMDPDGAGEIY